MSHRWDCPDDWEARREGERAHDRGASYYSNPYDGVCRDASDEWSYAYRRAEDRAEEEAAEAHAQALRAREARELADYEERAYYEQQAYYAEMQEQYEAEQWQEYTEELEAERAVETWEAEGGR